MAHNRLHFFRRRGRFYWRRRLPTAIATVAGKTHLSRSLACSELAEARRRALRLSVAFEEIVVSKTLRAEKRELTKEEIDQILLDFHQAILRQCEAWVSDPPLSALHDGQAANFGWRTDEDVVNFAREFPLYEGSAWEFQAENLDNAPASELLPTLLERRGISLSPDSLAFKSLARQAMQVGVATFHRFHKDALSDEAPQRALDRLLARNALTQPPDPGRWLVESVRLSFWLGTGAQGPASGALA